MLPVRCKERLDGVQDHWVAEVVCARCACHGVRDGYVEGSRYTFLEECPRMTIAVRRVI
jgi:hypothetical protein